MLRTETGDGWTVEVTEPVMVWEFLADIDLKEYTNRAYAVFERLVTSPAVTGIATILASEAWVDESVFQVIAQRAAANGIERWAIVSIDDRIDSVIDEIVTADLQILTADDRTDALEWTHHNVGCPL